MDDGRVQFTITVGESIMLVNGYYKDMRTVLTDVYLEFCNDYLTVERYAEHNGLNVNEAENLLKIASDVFYSMHPEY